MNTFAQEMMKKIGFTDEESKYIFSFSEKYLHDVTYEKILRKFNDGIVEAEDIINFSSEITKELKNLAKEKNDNFYTAVLLFLIDASENAYPRYLEKGIHEELFYKNFRDLKIKLNECKTVYGVIGVFAPIDWFARFYIPDRFWIGRFQFETTKFMYDKYEKDGFILNKGDTVIDVHIPSGSPMTENDMNKSFELAYDFFKEYQKESKLAFVCQSWLLYDRHNDFLNPESNIFKFMKQFDIIDTNEYEDFTIAWRIFGREGLYETEGFPETTSLQKAYKKWLMEGNKAGYSYGVKVYPDADFTV